MRKIIKTGLIGFGFSGSTFHAPFLNALSQFQVTHVVSDNSSLVNESIPEAEVISKKAIFDCLENKELDLIIITAPNSEHYNVVKAALMHDKHVLVEKPFVLEPIDGKELIELAKNKEKILSVYHNRRFDSDFLTVKNLIEQGQLGDISLFINRYDRFRPEVKSFRWKESESAGSGILWDLGAHLIDQALVLFGYPMTVYANLIKQREGSKTIDYFDLQFGYKNELCVKLSASSLCRSPGPKYEIHGLKGSFIKFGKDPQENALINKENPLNMDFGQEQTMYYGQLTTAEGTKTIPSLKGNYMAFFEQLYDAIIEGKSLPVSSNEALDVIKIIQLCEKSNNLNSVVNSDI